MAAEVVMLGMPGFVVLGANIDDDGELVLNIETTATVVGCPDCGVRAKSKGRRTVVVRDATAFDQRVRLAWSKRRWRCPEPVCPIGSWTETTELITPRAVLTERVRAAACRRVGRDGHSVAQVARDLGVGWHTVMRAVIDYGTPLIEDPARLAGVTALGMDETAWLRANGRHPTLFVSGLVDTATGRLLDVVTDRTIRAVTTWLAQRDTDWLQRIGVVTLDPYRGYASAVGVHLGHATLVVDHFHAVRLGNIVVDEVRRRVQQQTLGHRGFKDDPLYKIRRIMLKAADRLTPRQWARIEAAWDAGDPHDEVHDAWAAKELLRDVYAAADEDEAREVLADFYDWVARVDIAEVSRLGRTIRRWEAEVLAYHRTGGASNGPTEAVNLLVKKIKRTGHGFTNFDNYRLRLLLHCGVTWQDPPAARIRGRRPPVAA